MNSDVTTQKNPVGKSEARQILRSVPYDKGFHFFTDVGKYTGETAINLFSLYEELRTIDARSIRFHFQREDFQDWIEKILGDSELSNRINRMNKELDEVTLRKELRSILLSRFEELQNSAMDT